MSCSRPSVLSPVCAALLAAMDGPPLWSTLCPTCGGEWTEPTPDIPNPTHCGECCDCVIGDGVCLKCGAFDEDDGDGMIFERHVEP